MPSHLTRRAVLLLMVLAAFTQFRAAEAQPPIEVQVGGSAIRIPAPKGFADASKSPELLTMGKMFTPRHRRLLAFFVHEQDLQAAQSGQEPDLHQTSDVQTSLADEHKLFSEAGFAKVKEQVKTQHREAARSTGGTTRFEEMLRQLDNQARLELKGVVPVGVIEESPYSITVLFVARSQLRASGGVADDTNISAVTVAAIKGKPVWLITRRTLREKGDIDIASASAREWIVAVQAANQ